MIIQINELTKTYRIPQKEEGILEKIKQIIRPVYQEKKAVNGISFSVQKGECVAFLGANGAGKSTTIKMLTGIMKPTSGSIRILGRDPFKERMENAKNIGVMFGQRTQLWWDIPIIESFRLLKSLYRIPEEIYEKNMHDFSELLELESFLNLPVRKVSLGQRVRADLAAALLHDPTLLFLDEPTIGLDVAVKQKVYAFLKYINVEKGTTILLTSHDLNDLEALCQRLIILEKGSILFDDELKKIYECYPVADTFEKIIISIFERGLLR